MKEKYSHIKGTSEDFLKEKHVVESLKKENEELIETIENVEYEVAKVYCHITGNQISKCNTIAEDVISVSDDYTTQFVEKETQSLKSELSDLNSIAKKLASALSDLMDVQNGPPLITYTKTWENAMKKAGEALESQSHTTKESDSTK